MPQDSVFDDLDAYVAVPRLNGLALSPDGRRLVAPVQSLSADGKKYSTSLWAIDPDGGPARRLTRSAAGESAPAFLPNGDLLFVSKRPDADATPGGDDEQAALWRLPAGGGEAEIVAARPGGITGVVVARDSGTVVVSAPVLPGDAEGDADRRQARKDGDIKAMLWEDLPVRQWDRDLGPDLSRLFVAEPGEGTERWTLRDLTPDAGAALEHDVGLAITPDGSTVLAGWSASLPGARETWQITAVDVATGASRVFVGAEAVPGFDFAGPAVAPDGTWAVYVAQRLPDRETASTDTLHRQDLPSGESRDLLPGFDLWPGAPVVTADSSAVLFVADQTGHAPVFRLGLGDGEVTRLTASGAYSHLCPSPDGRSVYALRAHIDSPARPVRLDATAPDQEPVYLDAPGAIDSVPGRVELIEATAADGTTIHARLVLPAGDAPAPLLLWVHGGPLMSWHGWSWRWNPWLMAARGWAVLLPDPGLSQGYGDHMVQRAWGKWGPVPFADLMAVTDVACARADIDETRTAAMGGSYGGYMANWIAGHTDRFAAIVTHASLWALDRFVGATDYPGAWAKEWGWPDEAPDLYERNSPHLHADSIRTPMLVVHGDKDYRVPIGEGLSLWTELVRRQVDAKFLYFPDEGHWVLKPAHAKIWYQTVWAFLDHHVKGADWVRPPLV